VKAGVIVTTKDFIWQFEIASQEDIMKFARLSLAIF
jgi:hypothetical protein